jgi:hypothetical protein
MPDYSGALKKFRDSGYSKTGPEEPEEGKEESSGVRTLKLTDEESKELTPYQEKFGPGQEIVIEATGKLEGNVFRVMSVKYAEGGAPEGNADAEELMSKYRDEVPTMRMQTSPSPS